MSSLVLRRLLSIIPILIIVSFDVFLLALVPGDPVVTLAGGPSATSAQIAKVRNQLHLNEPLIVQYWHWLTAAVQGNLGKSLSTPQSVSQQIAARFPVTFGLVVASAIVSLVVGRGAERSAGARVLSGGCRRPAAGRSQAAASAARSCSDGSSIW